ncbi:lysophospholipid acyltransferase family protein [Micromonospora sp. WMMD736]|uniref:lysophospholipid acyltransferase family protein n=1 Tax=Micromonospora sp. WMMD736 TaxID=3404112 RepID=UPI003B924DDA
MTGQSDGMDLRAVLGTVGAVGALNVGLGLGLGVGLLRGDRRLGNDLALTLGFPAFLAVAGVRVRVVGEHNLWAQRPAVFVMNHQSGLDAMIVGALLRQGFSGLGKKEAQYSPPTFLMGQATEAVFVDRADPVKGRTAQAQLLERLRAGLSVFVAPEGTRSDTGELGEFRTGAFHVARTAGVPVVPVVLRNAYELMPGKAKIIRPGVVDVAVLEPISTEGWSSETARDDVARVRRRFVEALENWPQETA